MGKKSWNVYNADNIAKVRQDEAAAKAREEAEEQRMQEADAERRIQILRGLSTPPPPAAAVKEDDGGRDTTHRGGHGRERKRRKLNGEDDTDFAIRLAKEQQESNAKHSLGNEKQTVNRPASNDAPITDHAGHINLFPAPSSRAHVQKNAEAEAEAAKKKREFEDQYTMRFSNAAGFKQDIGAKPWYSSSKAKLDEDGKKDILEDAVGKDVWGNEDPRRKEREKMRLDAGDPLMAIRRGVEDLRKVERQRKVWVEERDREARELKELAERERRRRKRRRRSDSDETGLEGFSLDALAQDQRMDHTARRERSTDGTSGHRHRQHRHRDRSTSRRKHHRHSSRHGSREASEDRERVKRYRREKSGTRENEEHRAPRASRAKINNAEGRPGWEPGSGGRYSSQFATARDTGATPS